MRRGHLRHAAIRSACGALALVGSLSGCSAERGPAAPSRSRSAPGGVPAGRASAPPLAARASASRPPARFAVIGDFGAGTDGQYRLARRMCRWRRQHPYGLVLTTGDNVYERGQRRRFRRVFFRPYACLLGDGVRFRASLGNHDVLTRDGRPELNEPAFGMKARNYVVRRQGVRFVIANSNRLKRRWLRRALTTQPGDRWKVVVFHHPVFSPSTAHGSTPGFRPSLPRMFRRRGVDLVLSGHDHVYAVTKPLRRIRYVVTGGGGRSLYDCGRAWFAARCFERFHFLYVIAGARKILVRAVPTRGRPFHTFVTRGRR